MRIVLPWVTTRAGHRRHASTHRAGRPGSADQVLAKPLGPSAVALGLEFAKEPFIVLSILEVAAAAEHLRLIDGRLWIGDGSARRLHSHGACGR